MEIFLAAGSGGPALSILCDLQCDQTLDQIRADGLRCELVSRRKMQQDSESVLWQCCCSKDV